MRSAALLAAFAAVLVVGCHGGSQGDGQVAATSSAAVPSSTGAAPPASVTEAAGMARFDGYGDLRFGMDEAAFRRAWQGDLAGAVDAVGGCSYLRPVWVKQPRDFGFLFEHGRFARYDVGTAKEAAPGGARVGMDIAQVRARYGDRMQVQPHKYEAGASYLRVTAPDGSGVLVLETDAQGKVVRWRVGVPPQIDYVEGCG